MTQPKLSASRALFSKLQKEKVWYWIRWYAPLADTIQSIVIATANGFKGTVTTAVIPPVDDEATALEATIEIETDVVGVVYGDGTAIGSATIESPLSYTTGTISSSMATNRLIGRSTAGTGVMEEIEVGDYLSLATGTIAGTGEVNPANSTDSTMYLAMLNDATGKQQLKSSTLATYNGTTGHITSKMILNAGGTAAGSASMYLEEGDLLSTIEVGAVECDGKSMFKTNNTLMGREVIYAFSQNNTPSVANITTGLIPVFDAPIKLYDTVGSYHDIDIDIGYAHSGTRGTVTFTFIATLPPTSSAWWIECTHTDPLGASLLTNGGSATLSNLQVTKTIRANGTPSTLSATIPLTAAGTISAHFLANFRMMFSTPTSSSTISPTIDPQMSTSTGTIGVSGISFWKSRIRSQS